MPTRKGTRKGTRKKRTHRGRGPFLSKIKNGLSKVNNFLKRTKAISGVAGALANVGVPYADRVHSTASTLGYGRRRRSRRRRTRK